jgi:hypothetical protein
MIVYEVNVDVDADVADAFDAWLIDHVRAMRALPGFEDATLWKVDRTDDGRVSRCARYVLHDRRALDDYLVEHAPRMRADGVERFGNAFTATRRVLAPFAE